ncbi:nucleoside phosphorylase [Kribbella sp. NPDC026596]|uniref:nucleoside phosphorylase n=1 Tax=Kribbella sp. NPDC026596 TaxID=3155122 RepID=UPI0033CEBB79
MNLSPLLEDQHLDEPGMIEPSRIFADSDAPAVAVMCFFQEAIDAVGTRPGVTVHGKLSDFRGRPVHEVNRNGRRVALFFPGVGAPSAVSAMEEAIAMGCRDFIAVGGAGSLVHGHELGDVLVVDSAVRDEGTSHHYLPPGQVVDADPYLTEVLHQTATEAGLKPRLGRTWTTDAIFRETPSRVRRRVDQGCLMVEMEAAAFFAVGQFRGVRVGQLLYSGDTLAGEAWDRRDWTSAVDVRTALLDLALDAAARTEPASTAKRR